MQDSINENPAYLKLFTGNLHRRFPLSFTTSLFGSQCLGNLKPFGYINI